MGSICLNWTALITHYVWASLVCSLNFPKTVKCLMRGRPAQLHWFCCLTSICVHVALSPSFHTSLSICPLLSVSLSPSFTSVCLLTPPPVLSLWGGLCWLHTVCLLPADWLTEAPTAWVMPPWQHHSGHCVCICVCKNSNLHACLHKVSTYVAGAADECLTHGYCFYWRS